MSSTLLELYKCWIENGKKESVEELIKTGQVNTASCNDTFAASMPGRFMSSTLLELYKCWIENGKKESVEELIKTATGLICTGLEGTCK